MLQSEHLWSLCLAGVHPVTPANLWQSWSLAPTVLLPLMVVLVAGLRGYAAWRSDDRMDPTEARRRRNCFLVGWFILAIALTSPLCRLSANLVSAHMVQLMLLVGPAPLLLALGRPGIAFAAAFGRAGHRSGGAPARQGPAAGMGLLTGLYGTAIWVWHAPPVYTAILTDAAQHWLAFAGVITVATLFWGRIVEAHRNHVGAPVAALLTTLIHTGLLGALLTFAPRPFYPVLASGASGWGLTPLEDQQLAGLIMWVGGGVFYLAAALVLCGVWLRGLDAVDAATGRP